MSLLWAPKLPREWNVARADRLTRRMRRPARTEDGVVTAFRDGEVTLRSNRRLDGFTEAFKEIGYQGLRVGDLVIHGMDAFAGAIGVSDSDGKASPVVHAYTMRGAEARYLAYTLRVAAWSGYIQALAKGIRERSTSFDPVTFKYLEIPAPPLSEQQAIADFLDREAAKIDTLIEKQNALIERLRERRSELRVHIVMARHHKERRETNYWFGSIPSHWTTPRLSHRASVVLGRMINAAMNEEDDVELPYVAAGSIQPDCLILDETKTLSVPVRDISKYELRSGDVLVVEGGAGYGRSHVLRDDLTGWAFQNHVARVRAHKDDLEPRYVREVLEMCRLSGFFEANNRTATLPSLSRDVLGALRLPFPPAHEQRKIADRLDLETAKIDTLIAKAERFVELARERRAALITAAVTGQIDVEGAA